jgi:rhamnogalacturonyl hydrolase YesR
MAGTSVDAKVKDQFLLAPNGLRADGTLDPTQWIYNQGIMLGAGVLLYRVTGKSEYLTDARHLADTALAFCRTNPYSSGSRGAYSGRAIFNAIFFRNLLMLYAVNGNSVYLQKMQTYADAVWRDPTVHDASTNLYHLSGESPYSLLDQAAMVQLFALLSWDQSKYAMLA